MTQSMDSSGNSLSFVRASPRRILFFMFSIRILFCCLLKIQRTGDRKKKKKGKFTAREYYGHVTRKNKAW